MSRRRPRRLLRRVGTRDGRIILLLSVLLLATGSTVGMHLAVADPPAVATIEGQVPLGPDGLLSVQFLGDTMLGDGAQSLLETRGYDWPLAGAASGLTGDYVIANAEGPITTLSEPFNPAKKYSYTSNPAAADALARAGVSSAGLGNNHAMDSGPAGLAETVAHLAAAGVSSFGAGADLAAAERPLLLRSDAGDVGVVALGESYGGSTRADEAQAGTVVLSPRTVQRGVDLARAAGAKWVVAYVHWGENYGAVDEKQRYWAQLLVDAGYDLVVGHGPHIAQPIEVLGGVPIVFSLGNFVFGAPGRFGSFGAPGYGLMVTADFKDTGGGLRVGCLVTDNAVVDYQPVVCTAEQAAALLPVYAPGSEVRGTEAVLPCACLSREP